MNGLLDFIKTPEGQGLLSAAFGGLAGARRGQPLNSIGRAGLAGLQGYGSAQDRVAQEADATEQRQMRSFQMDDIKRKQAQQQAQEQWRTQLPGLLAPKLQGETEQSRMLAEQMGPDATPEDVTAMNSGARMPQTGFNFAPDKQALERHMMAPNSPFADKLLEQQLFPKADDFKVVGNSLLQIGQGGKVSEAYTAPEKINPNQPFMVVDGKVVPNAAFQSYELGKAERGATRVSQNVTNRVENKASESVASQVGPILEKSLNSTEGAIRVMDAANRVTKALDSGQVITGPLANARVTGLQIAGMLGVGGANDQERLLETRKVIRGLSEMTLQGRKEMSGQGAITDRESALAEKATSGDIGNLTAGEIRELAAASARASRYQVAKHKQRVTNANNLPGMANITPFFDVPDMEQPPTPTPETPAKQTFDTKPPAKDYKDKMMTAPDGKRYRSDGMIWKEVK